MDDFGGRTDDDLFADEFESVSEPPPQPTALPAATEAPHQPAEAPNDQHAPVSEAPVAPAASAPRKPNALMQSRHAPQPGSAPRNHQPQQPPPQQQRQPRNQQQHQPRQRKQQRSPKPTTPKPVAPTTQEAAAAVPPASSAPPNAPTGPAAAAHGNNTAGPNRHLSGANPRTKLTSDELAVKMEQMRLLNAEKTRKFEQAEQDQRSHAVAYEKGMEERRKRRAEEAERKKRGEEIQKKLDEEREKNRARKLKAMGSWDQEKGAEQQTDDRRGFRGANGGVRGERRGGGGREGGRFNERDDGFDNGPREYGADEFRGRGGRGGRGRGAPRGGGRGGRGDNERPQNGTSTKPAAPQAVPKETDFPALPPSSAPLPKLDTTKPVDPPELPVFSAGPNAQPIGKWGDEEMDDD
ncbi:hypothetical protein PG996_013479 [Apiospora saccharicola]|uniref:Uncharacterized protein n=1 Tax=Apiospora saccharicola TaxID=335842 RepID=A0ABR1U5L1_9PEZI